MCDSRDDEADSFMANIKVHNTIDYVDERTSYWLVEVWVLQLLESMSIPQLHNVVEPNVVSSHDHVSIKGRCVI